MNLSASVRPCIRPVAAALLGCFLSIAARPVIAGDLQVSGAWARATVAGAPGAAYFTVTNRGQQSDTLLGATSPVATSLKFHRTMQSNGMSHMQPAGEFDIAPGQVLKVEPSGLHLMLDGLKQPLAASTRIPLLLKFRRAGTVAVMVDVMPITATAPAGLKQPPGHAHP